MVLSLLLVALGVQWLVSRSVISTREAAVEAPPPARSWGSFTSRAVGALPQGDERPLIAHVAVVDLDRDGLGDIIVCDALRGVVGWIRQSPRGVFTERTIAKVTAPAHVEAVDFDRDGDLDLLVARAGLPVSQQQPRRLGAGARERRAPAVHRAHAGRTTWPASPTRAPPTWTATAIWT